MHRSPRSCLDQPPTRAVILAAGRGRRLAPHTDRTPKPLLRALGRPILDYICDALVAAGVKDVCVVTGYLGEQIERYLATNAGWPLQFTFRRQSQQLGTAHALSVAADFLTAPSFVLAADYILPSDYLMQLKSTHCRSDSLITISLKRLEPDRLAQSSSVILRSDGSVRHIIEKPDPRYTPDNLAASLIYIVPVAIRRYLHTLSLSSRGEYEIVDIMNHMIADGITVTGLEQPAPPEWQPPG